MPTDSSRANERRDLLRALDKQRSFLRQTVKGVSDEDAGSRTTVSALCLGGIIKHVTAVESTWASFIVNGPDVFSSPGGGDGKAHARTFQMLPGESLERLLIDYEEVARRTDELVAALDDLDVSHPLPEAPWFERGGSWSARTVLLHILAETAQHSGHADIIREALDGAKTMG